MARQVVRLNANLQPDTAEALDDLAQRIGGNRTTALQQAILLADLLYKEADSRATIQVKRVGSKPQTVVLPKVDPVLAKRAVEDMQAAEAAQSEHVDSPS